MAGTKPRAALGMALWLAACGEAPGPASRFHVEGGDAERGRRLVAEKGCGVCHVIDGVAGARGRVGPPLHDYAGRQLLAGIAPNTPSTLIAWLLDPPALDPRTGMPALGLSEAQARDIAAFLYDGGSPVPVYPPGPPLEIMGREIPVIPGRGRPVERGR